MASNFMMTNKLRPTAESPIKINADFGAEDKDVEDDFESLPCAYLLRFSMFEAPATNKNFYQRALPRSQKVTHCSVSDSYIVYSVVEENGNFSVENSSAAILHENDSEIATQTLVVVIDVKNKTEIVLRNPSESQITAVYVDETFLLLGSLTKMFQLTPSRLFLSENGSGFTPHASSFKEISLPSDY